MTNYNKYSRMAIIALMASFVWSCKPSEKNYREAYETTMRARQAAKDSLSLGNDYKEVTINRGEKYFALQSGDTIMMRPLRLLLPNDIPGINARPEMLKKYNVAVARFSQKFNAASMCTRWHENGYPGAIVCLDFDKHYIVIAASFANLEEAQEAAVKIKAEGKQLGMQKDCPYIIERR